MASDSRRVFRVRGTTDDVTQCELCGRDELKGTIVLEVLDEAGNGAGEYVYYGASCGAKAAGWTTRDLRREAKAADAERLAEERARRDAERRAWIERRDAWIATNLGVDALDRPRAYGFTSPFAVVEAFRRAIGEETRR